MREAPACRLISINNIQIPKNECDKSLLWMLHTVSSKQYPKHVKRKKRRWPLQKYPEFPFTYLHISDNDFNTSGMPSCTCKRKYQYNISIQSRGQQEQNFTKSSFWQIFFHNRTFLVFNTFMHLIMFMLMALIFSTLQSVNCIQMQTATENNSMPTSTWYAENNTILPSITPSKFIYKDTSHIPNFNNAKVNILNRIKRSYNTTSYSLPADKKTKKNVDQRIHDVINRKGNLTTPQLLTMKNRRKQFTLTDYRKNGIMKNFTMSTYHNNVQKPNASTRDEDHIKLMKLVMDGLGLQKLPDMKKINISQYEYSKKYNEYLQRIYYRKRRGLLYNNVMNEKSPSSDINILPDLLLVSILSNTTKHSENFDDFWLFSRNRREILDTEKVLKSPSHYKSIEDTKQQKRRRYKNQNTKFFLHFPLTENYEGKAIEAHAVEEANLRLMLIYNPTLAYKHKRNKTMRKPCRTKNKEKRTNVDRISTIKTVNIKIYQPLDKEKRLRLDEQKIYIEFNQTHLDDTYSQWLQFDVTRAVASSLRSRELNLELEVHCDNCIQIGARILNDVLYRNFLGSEIDTNKLIPVLNIITRPGKYISVTDNDKSVFTARSYNNANNKEHSSIFGSCPEMNKNNTKQPRCCRHSMQVIFKKVKGFEFIIQPKVFDAGYCSGRCPPRYNPAHHHAMLQSLIWKQSKGYEAPRPCCAPSKLVELEVLHVDEKDSNKLKISTWTDMQVVECACS